MVSIAKRIEQLRGEKNISRVELSAALGLPRMSVEKYEMGKITPSKEQQQKLADYFGVSVMYLRGESDDRVDLKSWLSGNLPEDDRPEPVQAAAKPAPAQPKLSEDGALFNLMLKSDTFKNAVLEILRSPEGQKLIAQAVVKQQSKKY